MRSPYCVQELEPEVNDKLKKYFTAHQNGFCAFGHGKYIMPRKYKEFAEKIFYMKIRPDDIFVTTFPRCGTTWAQEIVWLILNNLDYEQAKTIDIMKRWTFIELASFPAASEIEKFKNDNKTKNNGEGTAVPPDDTDMITALEERPSVRFIKSHLPFSLLPPSLVDTCKVVYVARDPRDVAVSFYHHNRLIKGHNYVGDFKTYWELFFKDLIMFTPYFAHLKEALAKRDHPNMLFLFYEEMIQDLPGCLRRIAKFYGKEYSDKEIVTLANYCIFENFKQNPSVNMELYDKIGLLNQGEEPFIRKGKVGGWREMFDEEMTEQAQKWMDENLNGTDIDIFNRNM